MVRRILDELVVAGVSTFNALIDANARIDVVGGANIDQLNITGVSTLGGDISIADKIIHTGDTTAIRFPEADTFTVETDSSERLRISSTGLVGINSTTPRSKLHVANGSSNFNPGNPTGLGAGAVASLESNTDVALQFNINYY